MTACMAGAMPSVHSGLGTIAFAVTAMVVSSGSPTAIQMPSPPRRRPNILYIIADDMRPAWNVYCPSCGLVTPHLDRLASEGLLFQRAYCQEAFCSASRNSFMSGRRTSTTLVWGFPVSFRQSPLGGGGTNWQSMPQYFKNTGGYLTVGGGKTYHTGSPPNFDPPSWSEPAVGGSQPFAYLPPKYGASQGGSTYQQCCRQPFDPAAGCDVLADAGGGFCRVVNESDIFDHRLTQHTIEVLGQAKATSKPFMVFAGYKKPHAPWGVPSRMFDLYEPLREKVRLPKHQYRPLRSPNVSAITDFFLRLDNSTSFDEIYPWGPDQAAPDEVVLRNRQAYYAAVSYIDEQVGKLTEALANLQLRNSTIVVVHADHGFQLGEHNEWEKKTVYELASRVPLLISVPWKPRSMGARTNAVVELVDIFPTLVALAGLPPATGMQGQGDNLAPLFDEPEIGAGFKNRSFTAYPVCTAPGSPARDYPEGSHNPRHAGTHGCVFGGSATDRHYFKMGYSVRVDHWRFTAWVPWQGSSLVANWSADVAVWPHDAADLMNWELYDHRTDAGDDFDTFENVNLADDPQYKGVVDELFESLMRHTTECQQCCYVEQAKCLVPAPVPPRPTNEQCRDEAGFCHCTDVPSQSEAFGTHAASIEVGNSSAVATWSTASVCDAVALVTSRPSTAEVSISGSPARTDSEGTSEFWVAIVDSTQFIDIGFCVASLDKSGHIWAGHQSGQAFLYRSSGLFADSYVTASRHCGKGTTCGQGIAYGKPFGDQRGSFSNITARRLSSTQLEFLLNGVSQGKVNTTQPLPTDLVGCVSACPTRDVHRTGHDDAMVSMRHCER